MIDLGRQKHAGEPKGLLKAATEATAQCKRKVFAMNYNYKQFLENDKEEELRSAVAAIDPDRMGMNREQALSLAGAMKNCGFSREEFAEVMARSSADKGTFAAWWDGFDGSGKHGTATEKTIFKFAYLSGWEAPASDGNRKEDYSMTTKKPVSDLLSKKDNVRLLCLFDSVGYTQKPDKVWEIRNREQSPTPLPEPMTLADFARAVTSGRTFYPTVYNKEQTGTDENGKPKYKYRAIMQQVFVVDIDNEEKYIDENNKRGTRRVKDYLTIDAALEICEKHGIAPFLVYETFSSKYHREDPAEPYQKFRLCFALDEPLNVQEVGERGLSAATDYFISLFGAAADQVTTDSARLIYGTDEKDRATLRNKILKKEKMLPLFLDPKKPDQEDPREEDPAADTLTKFFDEIQTERYKPYKTGLSFFDNLLSGGMIRQTTLFLLAAPGSGKTTLAQQIAEAIATTKKPVIYFNFEMSREQMLAKDISRRITRNRTSGMMITASEVLQGYAWTDEQRAAVTAEMKKYREEVFPYLKYNPAGIGANLEKIEEYLTAIGEQAKADKTEAPAIIIDYLHLISSARKIDVQELLKAATQVFSDYVRKYDTVAIIVSATNRSANTSGSIGASSGRDSSNIEYSAVYQVALNYYDIENGTVKADSQEHEDLKRKDWRKMVLKLTKNRFGIAGKTENIYFHAAGNSFYGESDWMPADPERTPFASHQKEGQKRY